MSLQVIGIIAVAVLLAFAGLIALLVHYVRVSTEEKIKRWLAEKAQGVTDEVVDELSKPLPDDAGFADSVRPAGVSDAR